MIFEEYDESLFISRFEDYKRINKEDGKGGNFTYKGLRALFEYLENLSEDIGENIKLDVITLCCEYSEYKDLNKYLNEAYTTEEINEIWREITGEEEINEEIKNTYEEEFKAKIEEEINDKTTLIKFGDDLDEGFIIQNY